MKNTTFTCSIKIWPIYVYKWYVSTSSYYSVYCPLQTNELYQQYHDDNLYPFILETIERVVNLRQVPISSYIKIKLQEIIINKKRNKAQLIYVYTHYISHVILLNFAFGTMTFWGDTVALWQIVVREKIQTHDFIKFIFFKIS